MKITDLLDEITPPSAAKGEQDGYQVFVETDDEDFVVIGARWDHSRKRIMLQVESD